MNEMLAKQLPGPQALLGTYRRFGPVGPVYEVAAVIRELDDGDTLMKIIVVQTGEEAEYRYTHVLDDPKES